MSHIKVTDIRGRNELISQEEIDRASVLMDAKGIDRPIREGIGVDLHLGLSDDEPSHHVSAITQAAGRGCDHR